VGVWADHLLPLLMSKDAARLGRTCKALRGMAREHFKDLGTVKLRKLQAALATFPRARTVVLEDSSEEWDDEGRRGLLDWLCEEERGRYLEAMTVEGFYSPTRSVAHWMVLSEAVPSLTRLDFSLVFEDQRAALMEGLLGGMQELRIDVETNRELAYVDVESQMEALGLVGELSALSKLHVCNIGADDEPVQWPNFIPPSLKALSIDVSGGWPPCQSLLPALPPVLRASGARLDRLEVLVPVIHDELVQGLVHVAPAVRCCHPTLKDFHLTTGPDYGDDYDDGSDEYKAKWSGCACRGRRCWRVCLPAASSRCW
jgi:hypothetical protein